MHEDIGIGIGIGMGIGLTLAAARVVALQWCSHLDIQVWTIAIGTSGLWHLRHWPLIVILEWNFSLWRLALAFG